MLLEVANQPLEFRGLCQDAPRGIAQVVHLFRFQRKGGGKPFQDAAFGWIVQRVKFDFHQVEFNIATGTRRRRDPPRAATRAANFLGPAGEAFPHQRHRLHVVPGDGYRGIGFELPAMFALDSV
jgi:hypothetical protein